MLGRKKKTEHGIHPESGKQGLTANTQNNKAMHAAEPTAGPKTNRALETTRSKRLGFYLAFRSFLLFQRPTGRLRRQLLFRVKSTPHSKISQSTNHPGAPPADGTTPPPPTHTTRQSAKIGHHDKAPVAGKGKQRARLVGAAASHGHRSHVSTGVHLPGKLLLVGLLGLFFELGDDLPRHRVGAQRPLEEKDVRFRPETARQQQPQSRQEVVKQNANGIYVYTRQAAVTQPTHKEAHTPPAEHPGSIPIPLQVSDVLKTQEYETPLI